VPVVSIVGDSVRLRVAALAVVLGAAAEAVGVAEGPVGWLPDVLTGWVVVGAGLVAWDRRPGSGTGRLLVATGLTWFVGNFAALGGVAGTLAADARFVHRALLAHVLLAYPVGRLSTPAQRVASVGAYGAALATPFVDYTVGTAVGGVVLVVGLLVARVQAPVRERRARTVALWCGCAFAVVSIAGAVARGLEPTQEAVLPVAVSYEVTLAAVAVVLCAALLDVPAQRAAVTDLVLGFGDDGRATLSTALGLALDDPEVQVGLLDDATGQYNDERGRVVALPDAGDRTAITVKDGGVAVAVAVVRAGLAEDTVVRGAVVDAVRLAARNARLRREVARQVAEVRASRERLVRAADEEGRRLEESLRDGAGAAMLSLIARLDEARAVAVDDEVCARIDAVRLRAGEAVDQLRELARGLYPAGLETRGIEAALRDVAGRCAVPVAVRVLTSDLDGEVGATAFFVTAEALANVAKHAAASCASVTVTRLDRTIRVEVRDDGVGGVGQPFGSGLRGLVDRAEALGGRLDVVSPPGRGTLVVAELPVDGAGFSAP
jgi:signal transduction histidine kinase